MTAPDEPVSHLAWLSDIHLNFLTHEQLSDFHIALAKSEFDACVITGDIAEAPSLAAHLTILEQTLERPVYFVLGNHDFYRSSIAAVREQVAALVGENGRLHYLTSSDAVPLSKSTVLVGHDGWADGRLGDFDSSPVYMNDFEMIDDFKRRGEGEDLSGATGMKDLLIVMQRLADQAVDHFRKVIPPLLTRYNHVLVATHVPPFKEACWQAGKLSSNMFLPFFASQVIGDYLREIMMQHPDKQLTVLCGHCHGRGRAQLLDNLVVETAGAEYGTPALERIIAID